MTRRLIHLALLLALTIMGSGCSGQQSALVPFGEEAERVAVLFWIMTFGGGLVLLLVCASTGIALSGPSSWRKWLSRQGTIAALGIGLPVIVLTVLLVYGFVLLRAGSSVYAASDTSLRVAISGEQWWWRVSYWLNDGRRVESANELHLPVGQPVRLDLTTADVIHSFWAPNLAGKLDMIPGRTNTLTVTATRAGVTRGQCAEYCGGAHAFMAFHIVAETPEDFAEWLAKEAVAARPADTAALARGKELFLTRGCGGCHAVRGTSAAGTIGPDLTHLASRRSLAAATLPNTPEAIASFIVNNQHIKPENRMPEFDILSPGELADLSRYLGSLH